MSMTDILEAVFQKSSSEQMFVCGLPDVAGIQRSMRGDGKLLAAKRSSLRWSRERLARALGITAKTVENHEKGRHPINHEMVVAYAGALGCRAQELAAPEAGGPIAVVRAAATTYPAPVVELLRLRRHLEITSEELADLSRYVADEGPDDVESLEIELLTRRASRGRSDSALKEFLAAVNRKRVAEGVSPWRPEPPAQPQPAKPVHRAKKTRRA